MEKKQRPKNIYNFYQSNILSNKYSHIRKAVELIQNCLRKSKLSDFYVSFNGGKDATIVLFLTYFALKQLNIKQKITCLYFAEPRPFQQTEDFINQIENQLNIEVIKFQTKNYGLQLANFKEKNGMEWVVMGSRKDDPGCSQLGQIAQSDIQKGYPTFKRVNPIIDWEYSMVWSFLLEFKIPYCKLYDEGYTYLGNQTNTKKNESLYNKEKETYQKAYLAEGETETASRAQCQK